MNEPAFAPNIRVCNIWAMFANLFLIALFALAALVVLGFALAPIMAATGLWAHTSAEDHRAQAREIERLLAEKD